MHIPSIASHSSPGRCVLLKGRPRQCHEHANLPVRCLSMLVTMEQRPRRCSIALHNGRIAIRDGRATGRRRPADIGLPGSRGPRAPSATRRPPEGCVVGLGRTSRMKVARPEVPRKNTNRRIQLRIPDNHVHGEDARCGRLPGHTAGSPTPRRAREQTRPGRPAANTGVRRTRRRGPPGGAARTTPGPYRRVADATARERRDASSCEYQGAACGRRSRTD